MSKKKSITPIKKLINFIDRHIPLQNSIRKNMETYLADLAMDNSVIRTIFTTKRMGSSENDHSTKTTTTKEIANVLNNYCQTKSKLIQLSKIAIKDNLHKMIFAILDVSGNRYITANGLADIMEEMGIVFSELDIEILMKHFGDGKLITDISFARVFDVQGK